MNSGRWGSFILLVMLALIAVPFLSTVSADQGQITLDNGETYSKEVSMAQGHTMYAKFESSQPLVFMVVDPNGNIIRYSNATYEGFFLDAGVSGNYTLVWQSSNAASTSLTYDYNDDIIGLNSPGVQLLILVSAIAIAVLAVVAVRRRKRRAKGA